jgi:5-amino-6-(5-phosphoribosylamino)uracil reductase
MLRPASTGEEIADLVDYLFAEERAHPDRPWVLLDMISSIDGATTVKGRSGGLGDQDDRDMFAALRTVADVILIGAGTLRAENYHPVELDGARRAARERRGLSPDPRLAIVSGRLDFDPSLRVFSDPSHRPIILTRHDVDSERVEAFSDVADVYPIEDLDARAMIDQLRIAKVILCEGGPTLNGFLVAADLVDEVNLTIAPLLVSGESRRVAHGPAPIDPVELRLERILRGDRSLFLRFAR